MLGILRAIQFLLTAPFILGFLAVINYMTSPGDWWIQWAALGLGIAWVINLFKVARAVIVAGGLAALGYYLWNRYGDRVVARDGVAPQPSRQPSPVPLRMLH